LNDKPAVARETTNRMVPPSCEEWTTAMYYS
jgi:hypothetical protein